MKETTIDPLWTPQIESHLTCAAL